MVAMKLPHRDQPSSRAMVETLREERSAALNGDNHLRVWPPLLAVMLPEPNILWCRGATATETRALAAPVEVEMRQCMARPNVACCWRVVFRSGTLSAVALALCAAAGGVISACGEARLGSILLHILHHLKEITHIRRRDRRRRDDKLAGRH